MSRRPRTLGGVAVAVGLAAALSLPAGANSAVAPPAAAPPNPQAAAVAAQEEPAGRIQKQMRLSLGSNFAGAWITREATVVVATTDAAKAGRIRQAGAQVKTVAWSESQLNAVVARLNAKKAPAAIPGWYVDLPSNSVVMLARPSAMRTAKNFVAASGANAKAVRVVASNERPQIFPDIIGGNAYRTSQYRCSIAFSINNGFLTAGHCGDRGGAVYGPDGSTPLGSFGGSSFPGDDYAWVDANSNWTPRPLVNRYDGTNVTVRGAVQAPVGAQACRSGSTTQGRSRCGTIQAYNQTVNYQEGAVHGLIRTNICAEPGDSGGALITEANGMAQGITSGGSGSCSGSGQTFFQPVDEPLRISGRTIVTEGGDPNPPVGCENYRDRSNGTLTSNQSVYRASASTAAGARQVCLDGPDGVDFDIYLQKRNTSGNWSSVASSTSPGPDETINYNGTAGTYRVRVHAYSGSGAYTLGINAP